MVGGEPATRVRELHTDGQVGTRYAPGSIAWAASKKELIGTAPVAIQRCAPSTRWPSQYPTRTVMDHEATVASPRARPKVIGGSGIRNERLSTYEPPQTPKGIFVTAG
jgi:hypothetical protein